jgi:hypothetical protein
MSISAVADTSFLIDWARYTKRDLLFSIFKVSIPESVLGEIKSENTISWIAQKLAEENMYLFTETSDLREEAFRIIEMSRRYPVKSIDYPEAVCIAIGRKHNYIVLSENGGAYMSQFIYLKDVKVWRAFEVLLELYNRKMIDKDEFIKYQVDTFHEFPRKDVERII